MRAELLRRANGPEVKAEEMNMNIVDRLEADFMSAELEHGGSTLKGRNQQMQ